MALFQKIRSQTDSTVARVFFIVIVLVFVFWGVGGGGGTQATTYATVNGIRITNMDVNHLASQKESNTGSSLNSDEQDQLIQSVLSELILTEAMVQEAEDIGLEISEDEMVYYLLQDDLFKNEDGKFDKEFFKRDIKRRGFQSQASYEDQLRRSLMVDKLMQVAAKSTFIVDQDLKRLHNEFSSKLTVSFVRVNEAALRDGIEVSAEDIKNEQDSNNDGLQKIYQADLASKYKLPKRVEFERISINIMEDDKTKQKESLAKILESINSTTDMKALAQENNMQYQDVKTPMTESQLDPKVGKNLFADGLKAGEMSSIWEVDNTFSVYRLRKTHEESEKSFDDVKDEVAKISLQEKGMKKAAEDYANEIYKAWKEQKAAPQDLLDRYKITVQKTDSFALSGAQRALQGAGNSPDLLSKLKKAKEAGLVTPSTTYGGWVIAHVDQIELPSEKDFERSRSLLKTNLQLKYIEKYQEDIRDRAEIVNLTANRKK